MAGHRKQIIRSHVHHLELAVLGEAETVFAGRQVGSLDVELYLGNKQALVLGLHVRGVTRRVHKSGQNQLAVRGAEPAGISQLNRRRLAAEKVGGRHDALDVWGTEYASLRLLRRQQEREKAEGQDY